MSCRHRHGPWCCDHDDYYFAYPDYPDYPERQARPVRAYPGPDYPPPAPRRDRGPQPEDLEARLAELETELARVREGLASRRREDTDS